MRRFASISRHTTDLAHHTDVTLQGVPNRDYTLKLFAENKEIKLQETVNRSWALAEPQYVIYFLMTIHAEDYARPEMLF